MTTLRVLTNEDDVLLIWSAKAPIPKCRGFAIGRRITKAGAKKPTEDYLPNRLGFDGSTKAQSSLDAPFQRYSWTDHAASTGDTVSYRIVPVIRGGDGKLSPLESQASVWSGPVELGAVGTSPFQAFFNRGFVISQFMSRYLADNKISAKKFKDNLDDKTEATIRAFLGGDLRTQMLKFVSDAGKAGHVYAALFELSDAELIDALCKLGPRAHLVLANGSITKKKTETTEEARARDENADARKRLKKAKVDVDADQRFVAPSPLAHNKFLVRTDGKKSAVAAWTGSTNWTPTGLCTQLNNGLLINAPDVAGEFLSQWKLLRAAGNTWPPALMKSNSAAHAVKLKKGLNSDIWFTRTKGSADLDAIQAELSKAKQGVLFLMFQPGAKGTYSQVLKMSQGGKLFVRGVVSTLPNGRNDESQADVAAINNATTHEAHLEIIQPQGIAHPLGNFAAEVTRNEFLGSVGHAIVHSKVLVIDPFSDSPVVITGSHNFSGAASTTNDENFIIIRGDKALAEAYAVNVIAAYDHYRWRAYLPSTPKAKVPALADDDQWQKAKMTASAAEWRFFGFPA